MTFSGLVCWMYTLNRRTEFFVGCPAQSGRNVECNSQDSLLDYRHNGNDFPISIGPLQHYPYALLCNAIAKRSQFVPPSDFYPCYFLTATANIFDYLSHCICRMKFSCTIFKNSAYILNIFCVYITTLLALYYYTKEA